MSMDGRIGGRLDIPWHGHGMYVRQCILPRADYVGKCGNCFPSFFFG